MRGAELVGQRWGGGLSLWDRDGGGVLSLWTEMWGGGAELVG